MALPATASKTPVPASILSAAGASFQLITFLVGEQSYALKIAFAREVQAWCGACWLPGLPDCVRGVMNLRGVVIPVIDLRALFSQGTTDAGDEHVVVVIVIDQKRFGLLVDDVSDIITVYGKDLQPLPDGAQYSHHDMLTNILTHGERIMTLLDAVRVVGAAGLQ